MAARVRTASSLGRAMITRIRTLAVSRLYRELREPHRKGECIVPSLRLNGKWLASVGSLPGQKIRVATNGPIITLALIRFDSEVTGSELDCVGNPAACGAKFLAEGQQNQPGELFSEPLLPR
jgi:hypothetical protein